MRVVIAWDSMINCSSTACSFDVPDIDLIIETAGGVWKCDSVSYDSSWEMCDFPVQAGEAYRARLQLHSPSASAQFTYFSIAWRNYVP